MSIQLLLFKTGPTSEKLTGTSDYSHGWKESFGRITMLTNYFTLEYTPLDVCPIHSAVLINDLINTFDYISIPLRIWILYKQPRGSNTFKQTLWAIFGILPWHVTTGKTKVPGIEEVKEKLITFYDNTVAICEMIPLLPKKRLGIQFLSYFQEVWSQQERRKQERFPTNFESLRMYI